ncbi:helix-turn-helix domain-containing protein [Flagellimonas algicola]|uniref:Helix-turn-helix transcriptional regulator n=1 Tax=Flagellimonas algicola TaxID=2583815 RepID=A0ABY2WJ90_9FLAO|nr:helix-turn-helix transcriptional regulator [Allomuricauda algicola]TMU54576.1 helix-turn-helix transcriptional regulator [Allomuricauda algicola]
MIKNRLKKLRLANNLTQTTLGKISGISLAQIGRYEKGLSKPSARTLAKLAKALDVDSNYFTDENKFLDKTSIEKHFGKLKLVIKTDEDLKILIALIEVLYHKNFDKSAH